MATIHHAIIKSAASKGFALSSEDTTITARHSATGVEVILEAEEDTMNDTAKEAWATCGDIVDFQAEPGNEGIVIEQDGDEFVATVEDEEIARADNLGDLIEEIGEWQSAGDQGEEEAEGEEDEAGSVVPSAYKAKYREIGVRGQDNGDWLASQMATLCTVTDGKKTSTDVEKVELLASANGIQYAMVEGSRGWQGRYRMTVANILRKKVADTGFMIVPASLTGGQQEERAAPADFCEKFKTRRKEPKAKAAK